MKTLIGLLLVSFWVQGSNLLAQSGPVINPNGIVNNASYAPGTNAIAPGSIAAIFGTGLTDGTPCTQSACSGNFGNGTPPHLNTTLNGATVLMNGSPVPILYATPTQIGIQVPFEISGSSATVQVVVNGRASPIANVALNAFAPGLFFSGANVAASTHADGSVIDAQHPATPGEIISIYATGLGQTAPSVPTGTIPTVVSRTVTTPVVMVDNIPAQVQFSGLSGCCVGLNQISLVVPANVRIGTSVNLTLSVGTQQSNITTLAIVSVIPVIKPYLSFVIPIPGLSGAWQGTWESSQGTSGSFIASITQSGTALKGTGSLGNTSCSGDLAFSGSFAGNTVVLNGLEPCANYAQMCGASSPNVQLNFSGTANSSQTAMSGTYVKNFGTCQGSGTWSATKVN